MLISHSTLHLSAEDCVRSFDPRIDVRGESARTMRLNMTLPLVYHLLRRFEDPLPGSSAVNCRLGRLTTTSVSSTPSRSPSIILADLARPPLNIARRLSHACGTEGNVSPSRAHAAGRTVLVRLGGRFGLFLCRACLGHLDVDDGLVFAFTLSRQVNATFSPAFRVPRALSA